ncbi:MAG TPA: hypothetical protein VGC07_01515 [Granulicella sp.]
MFDMFLALALFVVFFAALFIWVPLLQSVEALARRYPQQLATDMPDLREDDSSSQFTGKVA